MSKQRFRCIHCGDRFDLSNEESEDYANGFYSNEPDCCDDCVCNINHQECDEFSDADPGL